MFIITDDYDNAYCWEDGEIVCRRYGKTAVFNTACDAEKALERYKAKNPCVMSPVWVQEL